MIRAVKWLFGLIFQNLGWKLLALAIAVAIWAMVASEPEMGTFATVPLEYKNLPPDLEISSEPVSSIVLELRGPSGALREFGEAAPLRPAIVLDMASVRPGQRTFAIGDGAVKLVRGVRLVHAIPPEVRFEFEPRATREAPVSVRFVGNGDHGYEVASFQVSPKQMTIVGPSSHVNRIATVVTDPVDVSTVVGTSEFRVNAFVNDSYVRFQSAPQATVTVTMKKR